MYTYTVTFTEEENMAMQYVSVDVNEWIQNACHERARLAYEQALIDAVNAFLVRNEPIPSTKEDIFRVAFEKGYLTPLKDVKIDSPLTTPINT